MLREQQTIKLVMIEDKEVHRQQPLNSLKLNVQTLL